MSTTRPATVTRRNRLIACADVTLGIAGMALPIFPFHMPTAMTLWVVGMVLHPLCLVALQRATGVSFTATPHGLDEYLAARALRLRSRAMTWFMCSLLVVMTVALVLPAAVPALGTEGCMIAFRLLGMAAGWLALVSAYTYARGLAGGANTDDLRSAADPEDA
ncbi:hypothetical protein ACUY3K_11390 [Corynebacterium uberis]|uniref:hypothetical protein n=1 Tax=Corynebacterium TaxID=1716 RepID=UPI001D0B42CD|nr:MULTISPECIES: hypothetical protein [Corynebacterium]MCZ9308732.1 hypothetical protein [Corynebacterium sp. c6VSa_13]UDL72737.1 hypothetical protein LH391_06285 [Corynebacterium uberis]UDL76387.1 hypothetical protein LH393_03120 [Corynebacterium uberis]UDL78599.1 hypothetical protein LH394_03105 [Corynebacterium uberis]UDL80879.1 hypothetical protein LH392_03530 [Corynebacterium uberis]